MSKDYYQVLGVDRQASAEDIKKAFRRLAHQHHPDKQGGSNDKFKELNEAYQVLSNADKRRQYDQFGRTADQQPGAGGFNWSGAQSGFGNFDFGDVGDIFGDFFGFGVQGAGRTERRGQDIQVELEIDLREAYFGGQRQIRLYRRLSCDICNGSGAEPGSRLERCSTCNGSGQIKRVQNTMLGAIQVATVCNRCQGRGETISKPCAKCDGSGVIRKEADLTISIPEGIDNGQTIRLSGQGEAVQNGPSGDLYITFRLRPDPVFKRHGADLLTEVPVPFTILAAGGTVSVPTVEGGVKLKIPAGTDSGKVFSLKSKGFKRVHGRGRGDELVKVNVVIPKKLSRKQKELLDSLELN